MRSPERITNEHLGPWNFRPRWKFADVFERLRNMLELEIRSGYSHASVLPTVNVDPSSPFLPVNMPSHGEGRGEVPTLCRTSACEYPHPISSSSIFLSLPNVFANFQRDLKFYGPRCSLDSQIKPTICTTRMIILANQGNGSSEILRQNKERIDDTRCFWLRCRYPLKYTSPSPNIIFLKILCTY